MKDLVQAEIHMRQNGVKPIKCTLTPSSVVYLISKYEACWEKLITITTSTGARIYLYPKDICYIIME